MVHVGNAILGLFIDQKPAPIWIWKKFSAPKQAENPGGKKMLEPLQNEAYY